MTDVTVATPPPIHLETPHAATPAEAVRFDLGMARKHGAMTLAYLARAGWRLALEKQGLNHGAWYDWCENNLGISHMTVDRYIKFYYSTVGAYLRAQGTAHRLVDNLTDAMIEAATAELESKTATGAMIELGIVKRPSGWGGKRAGAGRKPEDADVAAGAAPLAESDVDGELCAEEGRDLLSKLAGWALGADDGFGTLPDRELANAVETLEKMLKRAKEIRDAREAGR